MRLVIVGTALAAALFATGAAAQGKVQMSGSKAFCLVQSGKAECAYDSKAACEKGVKDKAPAGAQAPTCVARGQVK